jgi:hypothetical protein
MSPNDLRNESFARYAPQGRSFAVTNLQVLKRMPLPLAALLLKQIIQFDWGFPAEKEQLSLQFELLRQMDAAAFHELIKPFSVILLSAQLQGMNWVDRPQQFSEQLAAYLWSQHQIDSYHRAAQDYQDSLLRTIGEKNPVTPRWTIVVVGRGTQQVERPLFRRMAPHGILFTQLDPTDGLNVLLAEVRSRAQQHSLEYGHWYIDGGEPNSSGPVGQGLTMMSYEGLVPVARREFALLNQYTNRSSKDGGIGVESVGSYISALTPEELGLKGRAEDAPLRHFEVNLLTQGAGCQIYSTTFVQWAARECLRRAQPLTLLARFGTRQASAPMEQLLTRDPLQQTQDVEGSLIDAEMGAYYTWINQSRLAGADQSRFLVWFEGHRLACAVSPTLPRGKTSTAPANLLQLLDWMR